MSTLMFHVLVAAVANPALASSSEVDGPRVKARSLQSSEASTYTAKSHIKVIHGKINQNINGS